MRERMHCDGCTRGLQHQERGLQEEAFREEGSLSPETILGVEADPKLALR